MSVKEFDLPVKHRPLIKVSITLKKAHQERSEGPTDPGHNNPHEPGLFKSLIQDG